MTSGSVTMSSTVMRGFSEENGSWNMNCMRCAEFLQLLVPSARTSTVVPSSLKVTLPVSGVSARMRILLSVVLPQPLSPTRPRHSPRLTSKLTFVHRQHLMPGVRRQAALADRERLADALDLQQRPAL